MIGFKQKKINVPQRKGLHNINEKIEVIRYIQRCIENNDLDELRPCQLAKHLMISDANAKAKLNNLKKHGWINFEDDDYSTMKILINLDIPTI